MSPLPLGCFSFNQRSMLQKCFHSYHAFSCDNGSCRIHPQRVFFLSTSHKQTSFDQSSPEDSYNNVAPLLGQADGDRQEIPDLIEPVRGSLILQQTAGPMPPRGQSLMKGQLRLVPSPLENLNVFSLVTFQLKSLSHRSSDFIPLPLHRYVGS